MKLAVVSTKMNAYTKQISINILKQLKRLNVVKLAFHLKLKFSVSGLVAELFSTRLQLYIGQLSWILPAYIGIFKMLAHLSSQISRLCRKYQLSITSMRATVFPDDRISLGYTVATLIVSDIIS